MYLIQNFVILGGDRRQYHLAAQLMAAGFSVACYQVPDLPDTHASLHDALAQAEAVLLPVPALRDAAHIKSPGALPLDAVRACLPPGARIFGGVLPEFDYFGVTPVSPGQWERIAARSRDDADWRAVIDEAAPWAEASFARHGVISILGL